MVVESLCTKLTMYTTNAIVDGVQGIELAGVKVKLLNHYSTFKRCAS